MSSLIPEISLTEFKKSMTRLKIDQIKRLKSFEVRSDGEPLFYIIVPPENAGMTITDNIRTQAEYLAMRGNTVGGKEIAELLGVKGATV